MVAIIDYGLGNLNSVTKAFAQVGAEVLITSQSTAIAKARHLVLPGQGAFADGITNLRRLKLDKIIHQQVVEKKKPILGICLGLQLMADVGYENGRNTGLGLLPGKVIRLISKPSIRLPHVGWDNIHITKKSDLFNQISDNTDFYFLHSYFLSPKHQSSILATCNYGRCFPVAFQKKNVFATLFHPEKSQEAGKAIIKNFLKC